MTPDVTQQFIQDITELLFEAQ